MSKGNDPSTYKRFNRVVLNKRNMVIYKFGSSKQNDF